VSHDSVKVELKTDADEWIPLELSNIVPYLEKDPKNLESFNNYVASQLKKKPMVRTDDIVPISGDDESLNFYDVMEIEKMAKRIDELKIKEVKGTISKAEIEEKE